MAIILCYHRRIIGVRCNKGGAVELINYRTINECHSLIVNEDKESAITKFFIRKLCNQGLVHCIKAGNKVLVDFNSLMNYLKAE